MCDGSAKFEEKMLKYEMYHVCDFNLHPNLTQAYVEFVRYEWAFPLIPIFLLSLLLKTNDNGVFPLNQTTVYKWYSSTYLIYCI